MGVQTKDEPITLSSIGNGALEEIFQDELQKIMDNIVDPNTKPDAVRELTIKIQLKPDEHRSWGTIDLSAQAKLAPNRKFSTSCIIDHRGKTGIAREVYQENWINSKKVVDMDKIDMQTGEVTE